ncbi:PLP-dependent aminotransferase family protein [Rhizobium daejeonense]|uniref:PLP-dependent aminotransferase family protein n=1 Tax=Rhizobium daejeonense TaxID=240521 RepID=A0A6M1S2M8_9HYPH|nr:PLP-dependent aminotransferase family protein [Rhizobium daejeonense]NGO63517.1 PLP-dependent aminotransferase family protein [Rhizobium daejeonense]
MLNTIETDTGTRVGQVMATIRQRISARTLAPGAKLPSIRGLAKMMVVSTSTVVEAYDRLAAEGLILSRRGSGFYVAGHLPPLTLAEIGPKLDRAVDPFWVSRQSLEATEDVLKPGCGWLPASWMPQAELRRSLRHIARADDRVLTDYGTPLGLLPLRHLLSRRMAEHGIEVLPDQIMLTESGTQAIDLLLRLLVEPGDTVLVDDPCYFNFLALLRAHRVKVVGVPYTPGGPDMALFAAALTEHRPRLYITNSALHNPTGATLSPVSAHRILKLADQAGLTIIEDDIFADFELEPAPRLAAFDGFERVIHIGSFSKTLTAAARCGFIAARRDFIERLIDLKIATSFGGNALSAELVLALMKDGTYRKYMNGLRDRLSRAMGETDRRLRALGLKPWIEPRGGMFLWSELPEGLDAADVARRALADNVVLAPGNAFSVSQTATRFLRFNVGQSSDARVFAAVERAMRG